MSPGARVRSAISDGAIHQLEIHAGGHFEDPHNVVATNGDTVTGSIKNGVIGDDERAGETDAAVNRKGNCSSSCKRRSQRRLVRSGNRSPCKAHKWTGKGGQNNQPDAAKKI